LLLSQSVSFALSPKTMQRKASTIKCTHVCVCVRSSIWL